MRGVPRTQQESAATVCGDCSDGWHVSILTQLLSGRTAMIRRAELPSRPPPPSPPWSARFCLLVSTSVLLFGFCPPCVCVCLNAWGAAVPRPVAEGTCPRRRRTQPAAAHRARMRRSPLLELCLGLRALRRFETGPPQFPPPLPFRRRRRPSRIFLPLGAGDAAAPFSHAPFSSCFWHCAILGARCVPSRGQRGLRLTVCIRCRCTCETRLLGNGAASEVLLADANVT